MSLKATAKVFIPSFAAKSPAQEGAAPSVEPQQEPLPFQKPQNQRDPQVATRRRRPQQQQQQHQNNALSGQKDHPQKTRQAHPAQRPHPSLTSSLPSPSLAHESASGSDHVHKDRPHKLPQHPTNGENHKDDHTQPNQDTRTNALKSVAQQQQQPQSQPKRQQRGKTTDENPSHPQHPDASKAKSANGTGARVSKPKHNTGASTGSSAPSGSSNNHNNNKITQRGSGARSGAKTARKASTDHGSAPGSALSGAGNPSTSSTSSSVVPGMEPTAFICLTDVIHPVRQVIKDGVTTMEQGSDAYLDWVRLMAGSLRYMWNHGPEKDY